MKMHCIQEGRGTTGIVTPHGGGGECVRGVAGVSNSDGLMLGVLC